MKKFALHKTLALVAVLAVSSVSIANVALANGGGGIGGNTSTDRRLLPEVILAAPIPMTQVV